jgi:fructose-bisphosphate aldolase class I
MSDSKPRNIYSLYASGPFSEELINTAHKVATPGKGILAADESEGTIGSRFQKIGVENVVENRRAYREMLIGTQNLGQYISGIILFEETLYQSSEQGKTFVEMLKEHGIVIGIKVDKGLKALYGTDGEQVTQGLTDLDARCKKYYESGARFAKWRAVYSIGNGKPSQLAIDEQSRNLARYAAICQANGLVPIVEPEVLMDGTHDIVTCAIVSERIFASVFKFLNDHHVLLEGILLKPNMIVPGAESGIKSSPEEIAWYTVRTLANTVPPTVPGIMFLSGGQSEEEACRNLNAINRVKAFPKPWVLSFSFGRALQDTALKTWKGSKDNYSTAREKFFARAKACSESQLGLYEAGSNVNETSLYEKKYIY